MLAETAHKFSQDNAIAFDPLLIRPDLAETMTDMIGELRLQQTLPNRLIELIRLRIAFRNQCRPCMSMRYVDAIDDGLTEEMVCSLERPHVAANLTDAEKAAIAFADRLVINHLAMDFEKKALSQHFTQSEIAEILIFAVTFLAFGRIKAVFDDGGDHAVGERRRDGRLLAPWGITQPLVVARTGE